jgi:hypothetical protein
MIQGIRLAFYGPPASAYRDTFAESCIEEFFRFWTGWDDSVLCMFWFERLWIGLNWIGRRVGMLLDYTLAIVFEELGEMDQRLSEHNE